MQGKSSLVQVKELYGNLDMVTCMLVGFHPATRSVYLEIHAYFFFKKGL